MTTEFLRLPLATMLACALSGCAGCAAQDSTPPADEGSEEDASASTALWVRLEAKPGREDAVARFLADALPLVEAEPRTTTWHAIRLGPSTFGIVDAFPDAKAREAHLAGEVAAALLENAPELLAQPPTIEPADVLAAKVERGPVTVALLVRLEAKPGKEDALADFVAGALPIVEEEPATTQWYGLRLGPTTFGIYDAFPDAAGRDAHLAGGVAAALEANAAELLAQPPTIEPVEVIATKLP
jgi:quinol monooxygenase YgiN